MHDIYDILVSTAGQILVDVLILLQMAARVYIDFV